MVGRAGRRRLGGRLGQLAAELEHAKRDRQAAVLELRDAGWSHQQIADALGLSRGRAAHLAAGRSTSGRVQTLRNNRTTTPGLD